MGGRLGTHTQPTPVALSLCLGRSGRQLCVRATCREGCPVGDRGEAGSVIHAGSSQHSQGPLPCASPEHREWMNQSRLIRAFHAKLAQMTDLETAWSRSFRVFLKQAHSRAARGLHSPHPRPLIKHLWPRGAGGWGFLPEETWSRIHRWRNLYPEHSGGRKITQKTATPLDLC